MTEILLLPTWAFTVCYRLNFIFTCYVFKGNASEKKRTGALHQDIRAFLRDASPKQNNVRSVTAIIAFSLTLPVMADSVAQNTTVCIEIL